MCIRDRSRLIALATFTLEGGSIDHVITEEVKATGMQSEYISNNSMITSGCSSAIVADSQIFDRDANGQPLSASVMYYVCLLYTCFLLLTQLRQ